MSPTFTKKTGRLLLTLFLLLAGLPIFAQFAKSSLESGYDYKGLATDENGNLYALRSNASGKYDVVKYFGAVGTGSIIYQNVDVTIGTPPYGIAVNSAGDVFVTSMNNDVNWEVIKLTYPSYTAVKILQGRFITGLAIDKNDNLLTLEYNSGNKFVVRRYPYGNENSAGTDIYPKGVSLGTANRYPTGIAVDAHNNIYFTDFPSNYAGIIKVKAPYYSTDTLLFNGRSFSAIGIDNFDRLYATEIISSTASSIIRFTDSSFLTSAAIYNGLHNNNGSYPGAVVPMASGKIFASDGSDQEIVQLTPITAQLMSLTLLSATPTAANSLNYQVVYSSSVSGVNTGSFALSASGVTGASISAITAMADGSYVVNVNTGIGSGSIQLTANSSGITPPVTNAPLTGATAVIDKEAPTGDFVINGGATATNNPEVTLTITAADATSGVDRMRFSIDNGAYTTTEPFATTKTLTIPATEGYHTINITIIDKAGNGYITSKFIAYDITPPAQPVFLIGPPAATSSTTANFTFTVSSSDTREASLDGGPYTTVTVPLSYTGLADGNHELQLRAKDAAGNVSSPAIYTWTIDSTPPVITQVTVPDNGYYRAGSSLVFKVKYNEIVKVSNLQAGTPYIDVIIGSDAVKVPYTAGSGTDELTFTYVIRDGENDDNGIAVSPLLRTDNALIADTVGNAASTTYPTIGSTANVKVNTTSPGITLSSLSGLNVNAPFSITASFTEAVSGISLSDFTTTNGTLSSLLTTDSIIYTFQLSPIAEGATSILLPAGMVTNIGGNPNTASNTISRTYDTTHPKVVAVAVPADGYYNTAANLDFTVTFSEGIHLDTSAGAPYLTLTVGTATKQAVYIGPATNGANFRYTVVDGDVDMNGIAINALVPNGAIINDAAGNTAVLNLQNVGSTLNVRVSTISPTVALTTAITVVNTPFTVTATFSEPVIGLTASDFSVTNGAASNLQTTDNITYTVTITPAAEGTVTVLLPAAAATSGGNNPSLVSNTLHITHDLTPPTVSLVTVPANGYYRENQALGFTVAFSENITLNVTGGTPYLAINVGGTTVHAVAVNQPAANSILFRYTVAAGDNDPDGIEIGTLVLNSGTIKDAAGNNANVTLNNVPATTGVLVNTIHPSIVLTTTAAAKTNSPFYANIVFSENVTDATINDVVATNATLSDFIATSGAVYSVLVTPVADGTVTVTIPADVAINIAGNGNQASNTLTITYDATSPVVTQVIAPANGYYKAGEQLIFSTRFNEIVRIDTTAGVPSLSLTIGTSTVQATWYSGDSTAAPSFRYTVQAGEMDMDGIQLGTLNLNGGIIRDVAHNTFNGSLNNPDPMNNIFVNTAHPTVTLSTNTAAVVNAPFSITASFTEAVSGISLSDFTTTNGTLSSLLTTDSIIYTFQLSPIAEGATGILLPAGMVTNIGGNPNTASNSISRTYDTTHPKVVAVAVPTDGYYNTAANLDFTVTFSEGIHLDTTAGAPYLTLTVGTATKQAVYTGPAINGANFRYTVVDGDVDMNGIAVNALVPNGTIINDAAGNAAVLNLQNVGSTLNVRVSTISPTVALTTASTVVNTPFTVTATFSETVNGLTASDFSVTNGAASNLQTTDNITYTVTITPVAEGTVTVLLPAAAATSGGNNPSLVSNTLTITHDLTPPTVSLVTVPANGYYRENQVLGFTVAFSENITLNVTGGTPYLAINVGGTTVHAVAVNQPAANSILFRYTVAAGDNDPDGIEIGTLVLNSGTIKDAAGNNANVTLSNVPATTGVLVNTIHPSIVLTTTAAAKTNSPFYANIVFSENVTDATINDVVATNATLSDFIVTSGAVYSVLVTPIADGTVTVTIPADVAINIAGNGNQASNILTITYDATSPVVTQVIAPANGYYKAGEQLIFSTRFNEIVRIDTTAGVPSLSISIGNSTVQATWYSGDSTAAPSFRYTVQEGEMDMDGIQLGTLNLNGGIIRDVAHNTFNGSLNNPDPTNNIFVNTAHPTVTLSTTTATVVNAPFTMTIKFSQAVTGFTASDVTATNAAISNSQTTDNITYTVLVTPAADGTVSLHIPADLVRSVYDNSNIASNTLSLVYDATAPVITAGLHFDVPEGSAVGTVAGRITATEVIGTLQNWTIVADDSNGAFNIDANGNLLVTNKALLDAKVNGTITLSITVSDGLNTSLAVPVTVNVVQKNLAPSLDPIDDVTICPETGVQTIQLTGASATEVSQTYGFFITTQQPANFAQLSVSETGLVTYQLQPGVSGTNAITVTIKDNGGTTNGGTDSLRRSFNVTVATVGEISISSDKGSTISKGESLHLTASGTERYKWDDADGIVSGQESAVLEVKPMEQTTYRVTASNAAGCSVTATFTVNVMEDYRIDATNILTPNGDGINDKWLVRNLDSYPDNEVTIYDRAGRVVYTRKNYSNDWNGTMNGNPLGEGTYYYILKINGGAKTFKGFISIIRNNK